jgi:hypothetical protein
MDEEIFRENLVEVLKGGQAHVTVEDALEGIDPKNRNVSPAGMQHTIWQLLEHMRIAQEDIFRYALDTKWESPKFPEGYWPANPEQMSEKDWTSSVSRFLADLEEVIKLTRDTKIDLTTKFPHGEGRTYLRQILLIADHNAYHLAQIMQVRKALGDWPE